MYRCVCASVYVSMCAYISVHKKWGCPLRFSSVNVTKSAVFCAVYVYICALSYRFVIKHHELTLQVNNYKWLVVIKTSTKKANRQINKQANKQTKKYSQWWAVEPDQCCWGDRAKTVALVINWSALPLESPYFQLQNAKLNPSNFTVTSSFDREINYTCIGWHSSLE